LQRALQGAAAAGAAARPARELALPLYNPDDDERREAAPDLIESCYAADGLIWSSPLYQERSPARSRTHSTGCICSAGAIRYLHDKVIDLVSAAGGTQGLQAINTMEFSVRALATVATARKRPYGSRGASAK
jgi:NAD(P)H-dependent FMN reductase